MKALGLILLFGLSSIAYAKDRAPCTSFLMLVEQDAETMNLKMAGANHPQADWYRKDGDQHEYAGVCLISPDKTGARKAIVDGQDDPDGYLEQTIGDAPL